MSHSRKHGCFEAVRREVVNTVQDVHLLRVPKTALLHNLAANPT